MGRADAAMARRDSFEGRAMANSFKKGDKVEWNTSQGRTSGTVKQKLTSPTDIKGHHVAASQDNPEYLVESGKSGGQAAHKPGALRKKK
jgi:hypothetical protein